MDSFIGLHLYLYCFTDGLLLLNGHGIIEINKTQTMGFLSKLVSATVKTVVSPLAAAKDGYEALDGARSNNTKNILESASNDLSDAFDDLGDADFL